MYVLKKVSFGSKDCIKELKLECAYVLCHFKDFMVLMLIYHFSKNIKKIVIRMDCQIEDLSFTVEL